MPWRNMPAGPAWPSVDYGKGHNGGRCPAAARYLAGAGWEIELHPQERNPSKLAPLTHAKLAQVPFGASTSQLGLRPSVILDGLLGIGATGPLRDDIRALTREINARRHDENARYSPSMCPPG